MDDETGVDGPIGIRWHEGQHALGTVHEDELDGQLADHPGLLPELGHPSGVPEDARVLQGRRS